MQIFERQDFHIKRETETKIGQQFSDILVTITKTITTAKNFYNYN